MRERRTQRLEQLAALAAGALPQPRDQRAVVDARVRRERRR
jgi:hypothetical protein